MRLVRLVGGWYEGGGVRCPSDPEISLRFDRCGPTPKQNGASVVKLLTHGAPGVEPPL
jgi:hypothetical protein